MDKGSKLLNAEALFGVLKGRGIDCEDWHDNEIYLYNSYGWGVQEEEEYKRVEQELECLSMEREEYRIAVCFDESGFDYWMQDEEDQNYANMKIVLKEGSLSCSELEGLVESIHRIDSDLEVISSVYNYNPIFDKQP